MWNSGPQDPASDVLAISITALEVVLGILAVLLGLGAFAGFWMLKASAVEAAREEARKKLDELAPRLLDEARRVTASRDELAAKSDRGPRATISDAQVDEILRGAKRVEDDGQSLYQLMRS